MVKNLKRLKKWRDIYVLDVVNLWIRGKINVFVLKGYTSVKNVKKKNIEKR